MSIRILLAVAGLCISLFSPLPGSSQPYWGTIFIDPEVILPTYPSSIVSTTYTGQGSRVDYDRRVAGGSPSMRFCSTSCGMMELPAKRRSIPNSEQ